MSQRVLVVEHLISLRHATRMLKLFKRKKHASFGYEFELDDLGVSIHHRGIPKAFPNLCNPISGLPKYYSDYSDAVDGYHLKVFRTVSKS